MNAVIAELRTIRDRLADLSVADIPSVVLDCIEGAEAEVRVAIRMAQDEQEAGHADA
jgi:hypothetical protein